MLGQRVTDLMALVTAIRNQPELKAMELVVAARGPLTVPALCLAALDDSLKNLYLAEGLVSFRSIVETLDYRHPFANFIPGLLHHTDLPQLTASLKGRRLTLAGTVDGSGKTMSTVEVRRVYGDVEGLEILQDASWNTASLGNFA
jgi:hypothetical protein